MSLYLALDLGSLAIPFLFSFHPKIRFYKKFRAVFPAILISAIVYLAWDVPFTALGYWGFNPEYLSGIYLLKLPIEEWLFFICIPYACLFTYYTISSLAPGFKLKPKTSAAVSFSILLILLFAAIVNYDKAYTLVNGLLSATILVLVYFKKPELLNSFYPIFLIILIPFFIVNGVLTGSFIEGEVVWYNNMENLGIRMFTIPVEDTFYAFGMILLPVYLTEVFSKNKKEESLT